jgi:hypothetical protein
MHVLNFDRFGIGSARFCLPLGFPCFNGSDLQQSVVSSIRIFLPLEMPHTSDSDLQQPSEEGTPDENAKNALMDVKEEEAILATTKAFNGEDVPTPKKRRRISKGGKASAPPKKKKCSAKKTTKKATKEVVDLDGGSSSKEEGYAPTE